MEQKRIGDFIRGLHIENSNLRINWKRELSEAKRLTKELEAMRASKYWRLYAKANTLKTRMKSWLR